MKFFMTSSDIFKSRGDVLEYEDYEDGVIEIDTTQMIPGFYRNVRGVNTNGWTTSEGIVSVATSGRIRFEFRWERLHCQDPYPQYNRSLSQKDFRDIAELQRCIAEATGGKISQASR